MRAFNIRTSMNKTTPDRRKTRLTDGRIILRPYDKNDAKALYAAIRLSLKEVGAWLPFAHPGYAFSESREWLKKGPENWKKGIAYNFAIIDAATAEQIGGCGINDIGEMNCRANLGYWVRSDKTGQGIAPSAARLLAKWGFEALGLKRIEIVVAVDNARSLRVAEKAGAKKEGILRNRLDIHGKIHDAVMHSLVPGEV